MKAIITYKENVNDASRTLDGVTSGTEIKFDVDLIDVVALRLFGFLRN